ncbi:MAG: hypothetical protein N2691_01635 [Patescibacteria group bacterium]|nr:hypothetical protein [Patescibacteria group bacterium]
MKKESIVASILGVILGISVGLGILNLADRTQTRAVQSVDNRAQAPKPRTESDSVTFELTAPVSETTVSGSEIEISGKGKKDSLIILQSPTVAIVKKLEADTFTFPVTLALGENIINVTYYPKDAKKDFVEKQLRIFSLPE